MNIVIYGANSAIAHELAKRFSKEHSPSFLLIGRNEERLALCAKELEVFGAHSTSVQTIDFHNSIDLQNSYFNALQLFGTIDILIMAQGSLPDQDRANEDIEYAINEISVNYNSYVIPLLLFTNHFINQNKGTIIAFSSVAGDRGRKSNYLYGSAKAALTTLMSGIRNRVSQTNIHVMTVKPGFVDSPMTSKIPKNILFAYPASVADSIYTAYKKKKDTIYVPFFWKYIMGIIQSIPESIFKKMSL